nr:FtsX-like permease family protein [uncultured Carboxylicivirga sp.]
MIGFKLLIRSIKKNKLHSFISIVGLGIGLGCVLLLSLLWLHNKTFNQSVPDYQNVYRIVRGNRSMTSYPLGQSVNEVSPFVDNYFRFYQKAKVEIKLSDNQLVNCERMGFSDASIFNMWGVKLSSGRAAETKTEIAISENMAKKLFPKTLAVGQQLNVQVNETFIPLSVCGVYADFPNNSTLDPEFIAHIDLSEEAMGFDQKKYGVYNNSNGNFDGWNYSRFQTYIHVAEGCNVKAVQKSLEQFKALTNSEKLKSIDYSLQPLNDVYLFSSNLTDDLYSRTGDAQDLVYNIAISLLILLIAIINYVFLTKSKFDSRLKEIGVQRAMGASRFLQSKQIIFESVMMVLFSLIPAGVVLFIGIPFVNSALNQSLGFEIFNNVQSWIVLLLLVLFTGVITGLIIAYDTLKIPSFLLLKGEKRKVTNSNIWSNSVISIHFIIFIVLISGLLSLNKQLSYVLNDFEGINPNNVLVFELNSDKLSERYTYIKNEVDKIPGVLASAGSSFIPPFNDFLPLTLKDKEGNGIPFDGLIMGKGMIDLLGIKVVDGESFGDFSTTETNIIYNESAARKYNLKAGELFSGCMVKGIVKDFNAHSMHNLIQPMAIVQQQPDQLRLLVVKTDGTNNALISNNINKILKSAEPDQLVNSYLLTDQINQFYSSEKSQAKLLNAFSLLAIILSVMGLFGMSLNLVLRKTKEIGIRKVNGAKVSEILVLLNKDFIKWVFIAFVVATPIAYYAIDLWLQNFAYKTELSWWIFVLAGILALGIALLTTSWKSWKAAIGNPIEALRYE